MIEESKLEALLFSRGEPIALPALAKLLKCSDTEARDTVAALAESLKGRGVTLVEAADGVELRTSPETAQFLESVRKEELERPLGKSAMETLAIILYKKQVARSEIDYIRGVNSTFMLRALLIRGLVERVENPGDKRSFLYRPTVELLSHLGIRSLEELPEYATVMNDLAAFATEKETEHESRNDTP